MNCTSSVHGWFGHQVSSFHSISKGKRTFEVCQKGVSIHQTFFERAGKDFDTLFRNIFFSVTSFQTFSSFKKEMASFCLGLWRWLESTCRNGQSMGMGMTAVWEQNEECPQLLASLSHPFPFLPPTLVQKRSSDSTIFRSLREQAQFKFQLLQELPQFPFGPYSFQGPGIVENFVLGFLFLVIRRTGLIFPLGVPSVLGT